MPVYSFDKPAVFPARLRRKSQFEAPQMGSVDKFSNPTRERQKNGRVRPRQSATHMPNADKLASSAPQRTG